MKKIIAITSCPVGIAHTYMAAENLEKAGKAVGAEVKVETHGSIGIENELTAKDIEEAAGVIIAADTKIDKTRFGGKPLITIGVQEGIHHADELVGEILAGKAPIYKSTETTISAENKSESENLGKKIYKSLMNGVSYMVPFVVTGGLLIAISLTLGGTATPEGIKIPEGTIWATMNSIGSIAMGLMVPILSAFIAQSIADRPGLVPGFVGGMLAANGALYGSDANAGFLGGIITGFLAGFIALGIKKVRVPKALQSIMPIIVIPILGSLAVVFIYVIGEPVALLFSSLTHFLAGMQGGSEIVLAMILGAMIAFDMGGPFNKVAFLFGSGLIAEGNYSIMGPIAVAICIPPLALGLASLTLKTKFTKTEREAGKASLAMGLFGITEGAIPFASTDPLRVIPSIVVGAMTGSVIAMLSGVTDHVAHGGPIVAVLGAVDHVAMFFVAVIAGIAVTMLMLRILKPTLQHTAVAAANGVAVADLTESETRDVYTKPETFDSITDIMSDEAIVLGETATTKDGVIEDLVQRLEKTAAITDKNGFKEVIYDREKESTTGIGMGIAIPHGKSAYVRKPTVAFARSQDGVEWHSLDGKLAHMIFMIAVPENSQGDMHLKILQRLSRKLMDDDFRQALMDAPDKAAVHQLLS